MLLDESSMYHHIFTYKFLYYFENSGQSSKYCIAGPLTIECGGNKGKRLGGGHFGAGKLQSATSTNGLHTDLYGINIGLVVCELKCGLWVGL